MKLNGQLHRVLLTAIFALTGMAAHSQADTGRISIGFYGAAHRNTASSDILTKHLYPAFGMRLGIVTRPGTDGASAAAFGYPTLGLDIAWTGVGMVEFPSGSHLDNLMTISSFFERDLYRSPRHAAGYIFNLGMGINSAVYDPIANPLNNKFNTPLLIFISMMADYRYHATEHLEVGVAAGFSHYSSGRLAYPNAGLNQLCVQTAVRYLPAAPHVGRTPLLTPYGGGRPLYAEVYAGGGMHRCAAEWRAFGETSPWTNYTVGGFVGYRYTETMSSGLGFDFFSCSNSFLRRVEAAERLLYGDEAVAASSGYSRISTGIAFVHQVHYGNFVLWGACGIYTYRHYGAHEQEGLTYQKAGVKYYFPRMNGVYLAFDCLAHKFSRASMIEFTVGYHI